MTARILTAAVAALTLATFAIAADGEVYRSRDEGFSAHFPTDPDIESKVVGTGSERRRSTTTKCFADKRFYMVISLSPLGNVTPVGDLDAAYKGYKQDHLSQDVAEVIAEGEIKVGTTEGRALAVKRTSGLHQLSMVFAQDKRLYIVCLAAPSKAELSDETAKKFVRSLRFDAAGK